jgi:hypothetical protein
MSTATQQSIHDLPPHDRRPIIVATVIRTVITTALLLTIYALVPLEAFSSPDTPLRLAIVLMALPLGAAVQVHGIRSASYPDVRATEAVITGIVTFVLLYALVYLGLGLSSPSNFSQPLTRVGAIYFTVTVLSTVGFGDITAQSDAARAIVTIQMLLDLALIAIVVRVYFAAARASEHRQR